RTLQVFLASGTELAGGVSSLHLLAGQGSVVSNIDGDSADRRNCSWPALLLFRGGVQVSDASLFSQFRQNLSVSNADEISTKYANITTRLNLDFWEIESDTRHSL